MVAGLLRPGRAGGRIKKGRSERPARCDDGEARFLVFGGDRRRIFFRQVVGFFGHVAVDGGTVGF